MSRDCDDHHEILMPSLSCLIDSFERKLSTRLQIDMSHQETSVHQVFQTLEITNFAIKSRKVSFASLSKVLHIGHFGLSSTRYMRKKLVFF